MAMDDRTVASALYRAVAIIDPVLDVLAARDPLGLKARTHRTATADDSVVDKVLGALAVITNRQPFAAFELTTQRVLYCKAVYAVTDPC